MFEIVLVLDEREFDLIIQAISKIKNQDMASDGAELEQDVKALLIEVAKKIINCG